jgi:hypothetical protein
MSRITRFPTRLLVVVGTALSITALAPAVLASSTSAASPRSGALHITKECPEYTGLADSFCTITSSNLSAIPVGSRIVYFQPFTDPAATDSDLAIVAGPGNLALGHVRFALAGNPPVAVLPAVLTLDGGTGRFTNFHARVIVTVTDPNGIVINWDGTYRFGHDD